jgi:hypothetical protein
VGAGRRHSRGQGGDEERVCQAVDEVVARQTEAGIDIVNDGEMRTAELGASPTTRRCKSEWRVCTVPTRDRRGLFHRVRREPHAVRRQRALHDFADHKELHGGARERRRLFGAARPESSSAAMADRSDQATLRGASSRRRAIPATWNPMSTVQHTRSIATAGLSGGFERSVCSPSLTAWQRDGVRFWPREVSYASTLRPLCRRRRRRVRTDMRIDAPRTVVEVSDCRRTAEA